VAKETGIAAQSPAERTTSGGAAERLRAQAHGFWRFAVHNLQQTGNWFV